MNAAKITIKEPVNSRFVTTKNGQRQVHEQKAELETESMRVGINVELDDPAKAYPVGAVLHWDVVADLVPGRYGIELARRMTLREPARVSAAKAA